MNKLGRLGMGCSMIALLAAAGCSSSANDSLERSPSGSNVESDAPQVGSSAPGNGNGGASSAGQGAPNLGIDSGDEAVARQGGDMAPSNGFVVVAHDPQSTFGADVDTASYDLFRRDIQNGSLPDPASVRLEEYVNDFEYAYPAPAADSEVPFAISLAAAPALYQRGTMLFRVGIHGKEAKPTEKLPTNLVFLVDVSGSMQEPNKLGLVKRVLMDTLDVLDPDDTVSIVTYAGATRVALPPTKASEKYEITAVIDSFSAGGSTAGAAGIQLAYEQAEAGFLKGGLNHIVLCTDGDFNVGTSSIPALVDLVEEKRKTGVTLTMLGFGLGSNDAMMEAVSNKGNGVYGVISSQDQADRYVKERLLSTMNFIAKDMKIQVEFNPKQVYAYRLLGYEDRAIADDDFRNDVIDAGEVGAGHRVTALYELALTHDSLPLVKGAPAAQDGVSFSGSLEVSADQLALVKVRYKDRDAAESDAAHEVSAAISPNDFLASLSEQDSEFQWAAAVASLSEILRKSPYAVPASLDTIDSILSPAANGDDVDRAEMAELFAKAKPLLSK